MPPPPARILVVEDNKLTRRLVEDMLLAKGWRCCFATCGDEGVAAAARESFDVILMDIHLPGMNGMQATRLIRESGGPNAAAPIIAFTAAFAEDDDDTWRKAGMNDLISKPFNMQSLSGGVARWVGPAPADGVRDPGADSEASVLPVPARGDVEAAEAEMRTLLAGLDALKARDGSG